MRLASVLVAGLAALAVGCRWFQAPPLAKGTVEARVTDVPAPPVLLGPGDRVSVVVLAHPESSTPEIGVRIDPEGRIDLLPIGPVALGGLTPDQARTRLRAELARFVREPEVAFNVLEYCSRRFYVFGEMERPGVFPMDRPLTALQALTYAGGFRPGADRFRVALLRPGDDGLQVYFFDAATPGPDGQVTVQPDDFLFVRLSGAGTFRDQVLPIVQSLVPPIVGLASLVVAADRLAE